MTILFTTILIRHSGWMWQPAPLSEIELRSQWAR